MLQFVAQWFGFIWGVRFLLLLCSALRIMRLGGGKIAVEMTLGMVKFR